MKPIFIIFTILGILILVVALIKIITRNKGDSSGGYSSSGNSFWDKVKDACCLKR